MPIDGMGNYRHNHEAAAMHSKAAGKEYNPGGESEHEEGDGEHVVIGAETRRDDDLATPSLVVLFEFADVIIRKEVVIACRLQTHMNAVSNKRVLLDNADDLGHR